MPDNPLPDNPDTIEQAERLYEALTNRPQHLTSEWAEVVKALGKGQQAVLVEVRWGEVRNGDCHERHELIVERVEGGRVYFINPLKTPARAGSKLGGPELGPVRRLEADGRESMAEARFAALFAQDGKAMLPGG